VGWVADSAAVGGAGHGPGPSTTTPGQPAPGRPEPKNLAYLEPHLTTFDLQRGQILYEVGETIKYTYFPHDTMVSLVTVMRDGKSAEMALFA
jgi:CRP-like cAMP-binding protein